VDGIIVVDKPREWTSHDVVNRMRRLAGTRKVGHLGTLDPAATGVLPMVIGRATRLAQFFSRNDKVYEGVIHFGYATDSYDGDGVPLSVPVEVVLDSDALEAALNRFRGEFEQMPPPVSAKKIGGRPAYELARKHLPVELKAVRVSVSQLAVQEMSGDEIAVRIHCSAGTYIRSIAHDLGQALGCGAFLKSLRRLASGDFRIEQARTLDELGALAEAGRLEESLLPASGLLPEFPAATVDEITAAQIRNGRDFQIAELAAHPAVRYVKALDTRGALVAIGEARLPLVYHPVLVL
jgi:tRNA pseudouridine55 synthase